MVAPPAQISSDEAKRQSEVLRQRVRADLLHVQSLQQTARKEKDIIKLSCVNDRFINLKAEANIFDLSHRELLDGIASPERPALFGRVFVAANSIRSLREEADGCVGLQKTVDQGGDSTSPEISDDPTQSLPFDIYVETPGYASPFI